MNKEDILKRIEDFTSDQLFNFIIKGKVTLDELQDTLNLDYTKQTAIKGMLKQLHKEDDNTWENYRSTEQGCRDYLKHYPTGKHKEEAEKTINRFVAERDVKEAEKNRVLNELKQNPNAYPSDMIRSHLENGSLSRESLTQIGIPDKIIDRLFNNYSPSDWKLGKPPEAIPEGYTEVYFWGIRGSGKTTALSAVLNTANKLGYLELAQGPGYKYMLQLQNLFNDDIAILPSGTNTDVTQYLPFTLKKPTERKYRSISLIELSGEIFQCFLYKNASSPLPTEQHEVTFNSLLQFLKGKNRKLHFFFVDYERANSIDQDGYTQANYLHAAAIFFNNPEYNIFTKTTDAIYVVTTKSDLMPGDADSRLEQVSEYLKTNNFTAFVNSLKAKCKTHCINNGKLLATPFSLGKVYFSEICDFDDSSSKNIIDILMRRIPKSQNSILDVFNK